jgi:hypothetical protein
MWSGRVSHDNFQQNKFKSVMCMCMRNCVGVDGRECRLVRAWKEQKEVRGAGEYREGSHKIWIQVHAKRSAQLKAKRCQSYETWSQFTCVSRRSTHEDGKASIQTRNPHSEARGGTVPSQKASASRLGCTLRTGHPEHTAFTIRG